jgi:hypothetical protein
MDSEVKIRAVREARRDWRHRQFRSYEELQRSEEWGEMTDEERVDAERELCVGRAS